MSLIHTTELVSADPLDYLTALLQHPEAAERDPSRWTPWNYATALAEPAITDSAASV